MEERTQNPDSGAPSGVQIKPFTPPHSKIAETIERVRAAAAAGIEIKYVHRVRNEGTEKHLPPGKWCTGGEAVGQDVLTVLDIDVTCPACLEIIGQRQAQMGEVELVEPPTITMHFPAWDGEALCGKIFGDYDHLAKTLRKTDCEKCVNIAEAYILDYKPPQPDVQPDVMDDALAAASKLVSALAETGGHNQKIEQAWQEQNEALRDIAETFKQLYAHRTNEE